VLFDTTLKREPSRSHTKLPQDVVAEITERNGVRVERDDGSRVGFDGDFTARNTTIVTWNLMHLARLLKDAGEIPNHGNDRKAWNAGRRFDFENPEHRTWPEHARAGPGELDGGAAGSGAGDPRLRAAAANTLVFMGRSPVREGAPDARRHAALARRCRRERPAATGAPTHHRVPSGHAESGRARAG